MKLLRPLLVLAVTVTLLAVPSSAWAAKKAKKKKGAGAAGVVEQVSDGTLVVKVTAKKKKGAAPAGATTKKFALSKDTKFEKVAGKKKNRTTTPASAADVKVGERVIVTANGDKAETVKIVAGKKKKKKKNT